MKSREAIALSLFQQWLFDRAIMRSGRATVLRQRGWIERSTRQFDARIARALDFERVFDSLAREDQLWLLMVERDGRSLDEMRRLFRCGNTHPKYRLAVARSNLAAALDRAELL